MSLSDGYDVQRGCYGSEIMDPRLAGSPDQIGYPQSADEHLSGN